MNCLFCGEELDPDCYFKYEFVVGQTRLEGVFCDPQHFVSHEVDCGIPLDNRDKVHRAGFKL